MRYEWHFEVVWENLPIMLSGIWLTVWLAILCMIFGAILGMVVAVARLSPWSWLRFIAYCYTELFRTTPLLVQIIWIFYVLPMVTQAMFPGTDGIILTPFYSGLVAFSLNIAAFMAEIYRAGITSISRGQSEASLALGMTGAQVMRRILIPQAITRMIPPIGTMWISLFKDTSLLASIGVTELMYQARFLAVETYRPVEIFTVCAVIYFIITFPQSIGVNWLYHKYRTQE